MEISFRQYLEKLDDNSNLAKIDNDSNLAKIDNDSNLAEIVYRTIFLNNFETKGVLMDYKIREIKFEDYEQVEKIYVEGENPENIDPEAFLMPWDVWIRERVPGCTIVAIEDDIVQGWAALTPELDKITGVGVAGEEAVGVAEEGVYVALKCRGQGIGQALLMKIIELSEKNDIQTLKARILTTNTSSIALHKKLGFKEVDLKHRGDKMDEKWKDIILMERQKD